MDSQLIISIIIAIVAIVISSISLVASYYARRRYELKQAKYDDLYQLMQRDLYDLIKARDNDEKLNKQSVNKGFSDEYDELRFLMKDIRNLRNELRRNYNDSNIPINTEEITFELKKTINSTLTSQIQPEKISQLVLSEIAEQLSFDHFYELKEGHFKSKIHDTSRTLLNVLHVLRTPLSGIKINIQQLNQLNQPVNLEIQKKYNQIEDAIKLIESNMRTLGAYEDESAESSNLKEIIQRDISLLLLTADKKVSLNTINVSDEIVIPKTVIDNVLLCIACVVENAIVYSPDNSEIIIETAEEADGYCLSITNFGSKIPDNISEKIFDNGFSSREGGYGIGLHLASTIISEKLNGNISFENISEPDGVKFHIYFEVK